MLSGNTAWLVPNTKKKPLDDPAFRKALAEAINPQNVVVKDYGNIVAAADPTGLLPVWSKYIDAAEVKSLGATFSTAKAKADLAAAGYKVGSDGFVTNKDGSAIKLNLEVPDGWSDWMQAETLIAADAKLAGININPTHPDYNTVVADRNGTDKAAPVFDLVINNDVQIGNTPWTYYDYIFRQPEIAAGPARNRNYEQYDNATAWALVQKLDQTPVEDTATNEDDLLAAPEDPADRHSDHPAVVQRRVVAGQQQRLDQLAVRQGRSDPAGHLERLLADGSNLHAHQSQGRPKS